MHIVLRQPLAIYSLFIWLEYRNNIALSIREDRGTVLEEE